MFSFVAVLPAETALMNQSKLNSQLKMDNMVASASKEKEKEKRKKFSKKGKKKEERLFSQKFLVTKTNLFLLKYKGYQMAPFFFAKSC